MVGLSGWGHDRPQTFRRAVHVVGVVVVHSAVGSRGAGDLRGACMGVAVMTRDEIDEETYEWLTQRYGERVAEALVPCPGHEWPLDADEQKAAHARYAKWANEQENCHV